MAEVQAAHEIIAARDIAEAQFQARQHDLADQAAKEFTEEQMVSNDHVVSPAIESEPIPDEPAQERSPKPKRMRKRYVCRNHTWLRTKRLKTFHPGESVFVKDSQGQFKKIGVISKRGKVPAAYLEN